MDDAIRSAVECRAEVVSEWLRAAFAAREVWLSSELHLAANHAGIDLCFWLSHPTVQLEYRAVHCFEAMPSGFGHGGLRFYRAPEPDPVLDLRDMMSDGPVS